jgi:head-tail adaptor
MVTVSARIKSLTGTEAVMEGRLNGVTAYELTVRSSSKTAAIKQYWRAVNTRNGMTFNISAIVNPDERGKYLIMTAQSGVADG